MPKVPTEVTSEQYQLKATFFANSLETRGYIGLFEHMKDRLAKIDKNLNWDNSEDFGVSKEIKEAIIANGMPLGQHLCHPNVLLSNPRNLMYYRCIAALSQKGLKAISSVSSVERLEVGAIECDPKQAKSLSIAINENLNAIYSVALPNNEKIKGLMYATAGTTVDGKAGEIKLGVKVSE